jgi:tRNA pseudouridine55 synthase
VRVGEEFTKRLTGLILVDKPAGCTSHDVVNRIRKLIGMKRVGHVGTLDPSATGLLALLTGTATRLAAFYGKEDKTYSARIRFGATSETFDAEGEIVSTGSPWPNAEQVRAALADFQGKSLQTPPPVSAKKISGVPAYKLARRKMPVELKPVEVEIKQLEVKKSAGDAVEIELTCSAGTYVRSLAHELGQKLGCGALVESLRRTHVGPFSIFQARTVDQLTELAAQGKLANAVTPANELLTQFPAERVDAAVEARIRCGQQFRTSPFVVPPGSPIVRVLSRSGELIAIGKMIIPNLYHPATVFQP